MTTAELAGRSFKFLRDGAVEPVDVSWDEEGGSGRQNTIGSARQMISEAMSAKNVAFLLGAGCSSLVRDKIERGIPTMAPLAWEFCREAMAEQVAAATALTPAETPEPAHLSFEIRGADGASEVISPDVEDTELADPPPSWRLTLAEMNVLDDLGVDLEDGYNKNLERLMEVLYGQRFVLSRSSKSSHDGQLRLVNSIIQKVQDFLWERLTAGAFSYGDTMVRDLYEKFYRKLVLRDRSLPRPWVFTTNYDLFNEIAMDRLGIPYANGFTGFVERRFNPASFRYALAEQLDVGNRKWAAVDAFVYLCKLHGSISWTEDDHGLLPIRENWPVTERSRMLIYPTPAKQNASLASPYADLFREFQSRVVREQSVLITAGFAFGDEHLNNIIYQALTIPTFRLIVFADPNSGGDIAKLRQLGDPRIWIIGGDGPTAGSRAHYFDTIVEHFLPQRPSERIDEAVQKVMRAMAPVPKDGEA
ncbi:SIR2 family protein [Caulobacter endophyticus]|uniref:SIR2 family protein n=1 Tax=Caulobacter endophyticus TaxID=2172652 RepID=UPI00241016EA|nr:SIR2 family protein [Caulobacter endophyticus]MDG2531262.1 SIR2 family protein [Caulobacter endophyticus]